MKSELALKLELQSLKRDVDRLVFKADAKVKPWYREATTVVAAMALLFSFGTTFVSYIKASQHAILASRADLQQLIKDISHIPQEHAEMLSKYKDDPLTVSNLSSQLNAKNLLLSNRAAAVIESIENSWYGRGTVLDVEYMTVATALYSSFQIEKSKPLFIEAQSRARDATTMAGALRSLASVHLAFREVELMRDRLQEAREIYAQGSYLNDPDINQHVTNVTTELQWAVGELQLAECSNSKLHLENALPMLKLIPDSPIKGQLDSQAGQIRRNIEISC